MTSKQFRQGSQGWATLWALVAPHKWRVALLSAVSLASALLEALFIVLLASIGTALVAGKDSVGPMLGRNLPMIVALLLAASALVLRVAMSQWGVHLSAKLTATITTIQRRRLSHAFLRASWATQQAEPSGRLQELLTSFVQRITGSVQSMTQAITAGLSLLAFLSTGVLVDPWSTGAVLVALAVVGVILAPVRNAIRRRSARNAEANLAFANAVSELGSLGLEMQTYGIESHFEDRIDYLTEVSTGTQQRTQVLQGTLPNLYISLAYGAVLAGVAVLSLTGFSNIGVMGAVMLLMLRSLSYGQQLSTASAWMASSLPFLEGVEDTVHRYFDTHATRGQIVPDSVTPLAVRDVAFAYAPEQVALSGIDVTVHGGEALGVIGPSGAGKSTLAQLLLGLRQPTDGAIQVGSTPLADVDNAWWGDNVAFVAQEAKLITGTVAENLRFFRDGISDADLSKAARQANILADIEALPCGFDTHLGEQGSQLSGGQRQRLSIARALVAKPQLLILDEPTSALDGLSEALIRDTLAELHGQLTVVIIAHRMSTLDICDRIMVIEGGRMTGLGTPEGLRTDSEYYRAALAVAGIE